MPDNDTTEITEEQYKAVNKVSYDLLCAVERLTEQALHEWPWPETADVLRREMAGSLDWVAGQLRGDDEEDVDVDALIAAYLADRGAEGDPS